MVHPKSPDSRVSCDAMSRHSTMMYTADDQEFETIQRDYESRYPTITAHELTTANGYAAASGTNSSSLRISGKPWRSLLSRSLTLVVVTIHTPAA